MQPPISTQLLNNPTFQIAVTLLHRNKPEKKVILKALEELAELSEKLLKHLNKPETLDCENIAEELVDVQMHLLLLEMYFDKAILTSLVEQKVIKMTNSKDFKKYVNAGNNKT